MSRRRTFDGATVVISGAGSGLGRALAMRFARAGATIVALDRDVGALDSLRSELRGSRAEALALPCDVTDAAACRAAIETALERFGRIDVVINNAGSRIAARSPTPTRPSCGA